MVYPRLRTSDLNNKKIEIDISNVHYITVQYSTVQYSTVQYRTQREQKAFERYLTFQIPFVLKYMIDNFQMQVLLNAIDWKCS